MKNITIVRIQLVLFCLCFVCIQWSAAQKNHNFLFTKGENNLSTITTGAVHSAQCSVIEYPDFLVVYEITNIPKTENDSIKTENPLITFIDSVYRQKPIKYVLNSHYHSHSLSVITPFLDRGATLVTSSKNLEVYNKRKLFGDQTSDGYATSIIAITSDTILLAETKNPIEVLYLKKSDYSSIPTETFLFFYFPSTKLLAASCMVYLRDYNEKYGYKGLIYGNRLGDVKKIISDKSLNVDHTLQLFRLRVDGEHRQPPVFPISYLNNVLEHSWHRRDLADHIQNMSLEELTTKQDSLLNYFGENDIYHIVLNVAVYELIEKKEYKKALAIAKILIMYEPDSLNEIDTLGEAYFNNGQIVMAKHYDEILKNSKRDTEGLGIDFWESNQKERLSKDVNVAK